MRPRLLRHCLCLALAALAPLPLAAEEPAEPSAGTERPLAAPSLHGVLRLSLAEAVRMGLENNLDVEVERYTPYITERDETVAWGAYDPLLDGSFTYASIEQPSNFNLNVGVTQSEDYITGGDVGFTGLVPLLGSSYELRFESEQDDTNSSNTRYDPTLTSGFLLQLAQPLLKNLLFNDEWTQVQTSSLASESARENFRRQVMDTVQRIASNYWVLIANEEKQRVAEKSLETARALLEQTKTQFEVGVVSKVEVVEAEAGVAERDVNLIRAKNAYRGSQDDLINVVLGRHLAANSTLEITPTDRPEDYITYEIDIEEAVRKAFLHRPELAVARQDIERGELELGFARNQQLPQLDLVVSYGNQGLAGDGNEKSCSFVTDPVENAACLANATAISTDYSRTVDGFFTGDAAEQVTVGARFSIPIPNTAPRATASKRELELRRTRSEMVRLEQNIILEVRKFVRDLESAQEGIRAAERRRVASEEQLRAERIRLEYGESTPFDVLQREQDLVQAESEKIDALRIYRVSATDLDRAQGTILNSNNVVVEEVGALR